MTDRPSPFEDPQIAAILKQHGVVHRPGLADEMLQEIGPLLAADGYDMDDLDEDVDIDQLNAAMDKAVERRNMELMTPVGEARDRTINTLRKVAVAFESQPPGAVEQIVGKLRRDPTMSRPSVGHLLGVTMEMLDAWHRDKNLRAVLKRVSFTNMPPAVKALAPTLTSLARKGRAFRSLDNLILTHGGSVVADAGAYLVAASVVTLAKKRGASFWRVLDELLPGTDNSSNFAQGSAFGQAAVQQISAQGYLNQFGAWLARLDHESEFEAGDIELFESLVNAAQHEGLDPHDPDDFGHWIDLLMMLENRAAAGFGLALLHEYVSFRLQLDDDPKAWEEPHEMISQTILEAPGQPQDFAAALHAAEQLPAEQRHKAINELPVVAGLLKLRDWLGTSQPITSTSVPKRADIETVAAMIGLEARGVARLADAIPPDHSQFSGSKQTVYVRSALDLPELMAWWVALENVEIIQITSTRVQLSPSAQEALDSDTVPLEEAERLVAAFVSGILTHRLGQSPYEVPALGHAIARIIASLVDETDELVALDDEPEAELIELVSRQLLGLLADMGLLELQDGEPFIPETLRVPLIHGLVMAVDYVAVFVDFAERQESGTL